MDKKRMAAGQRLLDAALEFWNACREEGQDGAVQWLEGTGGELLIFTRSEYRDCLLQNIHRLSLTDQVHFFSEEIPADGQGADHE